MAKVSISNEQQGSQKALSAKGKAKKDGGGNKGGKEQETPRDKPKRKGPVDAVPLHPEDWAFYDVPDEVKSPIQSLFNSPPDKTPILFSNTSKYSAILVVKWNFYYHYANLTDDLSSQLLTHDL